MDKETVSDDRVAFGKAMVELRVARGVSRAALAQATRIREDFVAALEDGRFDSLPGEVFGRGFVRSIAKTLGTDSSIVIAHFDRAWGPSIHPQSVLKVEIKNRPRIDRTEIFKVKWLYLMSLARRLFGPRKLVWLASVGIVLCLVPLISVGHRRYEWMTAFKSHFSKEESARPLGQEAKELSEISRSGDDEGRLTVGGTTVVGSSQGTIQKNQKSPVSTTADAHEPLMSSVAIPQPIDDGESHSPPFAERSGQSMNGDPSSFPLKGSPDQETIQGPHVLVGTQVLELVVIDPVRIKFEPDQGPSVVRELKPDTYRFSFGTKADLMVYDAAALKILFNGKSIGSLGNKGRIRRLSFQAEALKSAKSL